MAIEVFQERLGNASFARLMRKGVGASLYCTQQYLACNVKHSTLARCARWLLMTADRAGRVQFTLSREFLGIMLSVDEGDMRQAIGELTRLDAITYCKSNLTISDAYILERLSCECYLACKTAFAKSLAD
jgi:hypothetical protein